MSQNDFNIANQGFPATRADLNSALQALASNSSGATEPATKYAYMWWYDTATDILKMRNGANDAWINIASFDQANNAWLIVAKTSLTGSAVIPSGTTAQRDGSPAAGYVRFNTTLTQFEVYDGASWITFATGANLPTEGSFGSRNKIINGAMEVAQLGANFSGGTANADDAYTLDQWYILSEGSDTIDVDQIADSPDTGGKCIRLDVETTGEKFGIAQIIEAANCVGLVGNTVKLSFSAKVSSARVDTVKAAVVAWSGTADSVTSDIVSTWNADGTTPTLIANATFENTPADLGVTTDWATYSITANVDTASTANLIVFIWSDDATNPLAGDFLYVTNVQLEVGNTATPFEHRSFGQELALCERYYAKSYSYGIAPGSATDLGALRVYNPVAASVGVVNLQVVFKQQMRAAPTISIWTPAGVLGSLRDESGADRAASAADISNTGARITNDVGTNAAQMKAQWAASARL